MSVTAALSESVTVITFLPIIIFTTVLSGLFLIYSIKGEYNKYNKKHKNNKKITKGSQTVDEFKGAFGPASRLRP